MTERLARTLLYHFGVLTRRPRTGTLGVPNATMRCFVSLRRSARHIPHFAGMRLRTYFERPATSEDDARNARRALATGTANSFIGLLEHFLRPRPIHSISDMSETTLQVSLKLSSRKLATVSQSRLLSLTLLRSIEMAVLDLLTCFFLQLPKHMYLAFLSSSLRFFI